MLSDAIVKVSCGSVVSTLELKLELPRCRMWKRFGRMSVVVLSL